MLQNMHLNDNDAGSDLDEDPEDPYAVILLSSEGKKCIRASWLSTLIVKAFGKSLGFIYLDFKIRAIWMPRENSNVLTST